MDPNDVTGRAKKLEEKEEEEGEELFRSALESARAVAWLGALLSVLSEEGKKGRKQFPSLQCPRLSSPLIVLLLLLLLSPSCSPAAWSLPSGKIGPLSPSDRSAALPACVPWQMMHSDGPDEIVLPPLEPARPLVRLRFIEFVSQLHCPPSLTRTVPILSNWTIARQTHLKIN